MHETNDIRRSGASKRAGALALAALTAGTVMLGSPRVAHAEEVSPDGKGIVGGALLGAELVVFVEAIAGVRNSTAYIVGAGLGAVAGGAGGYGIEASVDEGRVPVYLLAGGLALVIPALVVTLDQTRYMPADTAREDKPTNLPPSDPGKPGGSSVVGAEPKPAPGAAPAPGTAPAPTPAPAPGGAGGGTQAPLSLLNVNPNGGFRVGVPVPEVRNGFGSDAAKMRALGVQNAGTELRFPVVRVTF